MDLRFIQVFRSTLYRNSSKKFEYPPSSPSPTFIYLFIIFDTEVAEPIEVQKKQGQKFRSYKKKSRAVDS
jgi:hypothetical protein